MVKVNLIENEKYKTAIDDEKEVKKKIKSQIDKSSYQFFPTIMPNIIRE